MTWTLSQFRAGDLVEVRSKEEIFDTLDARGCLDELPFMPEMLAFCGKQFVVEAVAHKTCDTAKKTSTGRRLNNTVHLQGNRCDGAAHGGCQADCLVFWKDAWLKPATTPRTLPVLSSNAASRITEERLREQGERGNGTPDAPLYFCQATQMFDATEHLSPFDVRQYVYDVTTGNRSIRTTLRVTSLAAFRFVLRRTPFGYRAFKSLTEGVHRVVTGRGAPRWHGEIPDGQRTPTTRLDLQPGERVRIKSQDEIEKTLDGRNKNRGLLFDPEEMAPFCGKTATVRMAVTKIIDEPTGKMLQMKESCIMLEGIFCKAEYAPCRLNCPRAIPSYWREAWLERI